VSTQVTNAFVHQYDANFQHLSQQETARLRSAVRVKDGVKGTSTTFERIGTVSMQKRTSRHQDTHLVDTPHTRRRVFLDPYEVGDLIDDEDEVRILIDPDSAYAQAFVYAGARQLDDFVVTAMNGNATAVTATESAETATTVALPSAQKVAAASTGLTLAKLRAATRILDGAEVPKGDRWIAYDALGLEDILGDSTATSADYNSVRLLMSADIDTFHGFKWLHSERLPDNSGSDGSLFYAWHRRGVGLAFGFDIKTEMTIRTDKSNSLQVLTKLMAGAVRIEDAMVVEMDVLD
tara:strand:+ start:467 stop:1345 length:879 start_codon:yes stop_codon:yes gene_type:complete